MRQSVHAQHCGNLDCDPLLVFTLVIGLWSASILVVPAFYLKMLLMALLLLFAPVPAKAWCDGITKGMPNLSSISKRSDHFWLDGIRASVWERKVEILVDEAGLTCLRKSLDEVTSCLKKGFTIKDHFESDWVFALISEGGAGWTEIGHL